MSALLTDPTEERRPAAPRGFEPASARRPRRARLPPFVHKTWESLRIALGSLRANKLRTALTLVGVVVGVAAVITVVTILQGLDGLHPLEAPAGHHLARGLHQVQPSQGRDRGRRRGGRAPLHGLLAH